MIALFLLALIGLATSLYAYIIEGKIHNTPNYKPICDLSDRVSCSKPIKSDYGRLFFVSNSVIGIFFYSIIAIAALLNLKTLLLFITVCGVVASCFLAYILYVKIRSLCLVCTTIYTVNVLLFVGVLYART